MDNNDKNDIVKQPTNKESTSRIDTENVGLNTERALIETEADPNIVQNKVEEYNDEVTNKKFINSGRKSFVFKNREVSEQVNSTVFIRVLLII